MCAIERFALLITLAMLTLLGWVPPASADPQRLLLQTIGGHTQPPLRPEIRPALRDPFELAPVANASPPLPPVVEPVVNTAFIPPVMPPTPTLAFAGRLRTADGRWLVMGQWESGVPVAMEVGKDLGNGYRVERISDHVVELLNPQTQQVMQLAVPPVPRFETW